MRKLYFMLSAMVALVLASCTNTEIIENKKVDKGDMPINFTTFMTKQNAPLSKAEITTLATLQNVGFKVTAAYTGASDMSISAPLNFMLNEEVTYSAPDWVYTNTRYWPADPTHRVSFFAYSTIGGTENVLNPSGYPQLQYIVPSSQKDQKDIVVASLTNQTRPAVNTPVYFNFHHALSALCFAVKTDHTANTVEINDLTIDLTPLKSFGTFTFANDFQNGSWTLDATTFHSNNNDTIVSGLTTNLNTSTYTSLVNNAADNYLMILPQQIAANSVPIMIKFSLITSGGATMTGYTATGYLPAITLLKDKKYTYNLTLKVDDVLSQDFAITFGNPTVQAWTNETLSTDIP